MFFSKETIPEVYKCESCGKDAQHILSIPAYTVNKFKGNPGYFNKGLNCWIDNDSHLDKVLEEKGLVRQEDVNPNLLSTMFEDEANHMRDNKIENELIAAATEKYKGHDNASQLVEEEVYTQEYCDKRFKEDKILQSIDKQYDKSLKED